MQLAYGIAFVFVILMLAMAYAYEHEISKLDDLVDAQATRIRSLMTELEIADHVIDSFSITRPAPDNIVRLPPREQT